MRLLDSDGLLTSGFGRRPEWTYGRRGLKGDYRFANRGADQMAFVGITLVAAIVAAGAEPGAQVTDSSPKVASEVWSSCLANKSKEGAKTSESDEVVVDAAFSQCARYERGVIALNVNRALTAPNQTKTRAELTDEFATQLNKLKASSRSFFITGVRNERQGSDIDQLVAKAQQNVIDARQGKIEIFKQSCLNRDEYLSLLSNVTDRDRTILIETCRTAGASKTHKIKK